MLRNFGSFRHAFGNLGSLGAVVALWAFTEILAAPEATEGRQQGIPPPPPGPPPGWGNALAGQVASDSCLLGTCTGWYFYCIVVTVRVLLGL